MDGRYQVMPALSAEEYAALKADIEEHGVLVPVEYDDEGNILDGFHRVQICQELGLDWPKVVRQDLTDAQKLEHAWTLNLARRHLSREQKQRIAIRLRRDGWTQERIAQTLSVSPATISMWLTEFINSDELAASTHITGRDGKRYPTRKVHRSSQSRTAEVKPAEHTELALSAITHKADTPERSSALGEDVPSLSHPHVEQTAAGTDGRPLLEPYTSHDAIQNRPKTLTEAAGSPTAPNGLTPHHEALDPSAGDWLALVGELYTAFRSLEDRQDVMTIAQSWSHQMTATYVHQCAYVISKLQEILQTLHTIVTNEEPSLGAKESYREAESPHGDVGALDEPAKEELNGIPLALEGAVVASTIALEERREEADDGLSPSMDAEENNQRSLPRDSSHHDDPLFTAHEMTTPVLPTANEVKAMQERGETAGGRPRGDDEGAVQQDISAHGHAQGAQHKCSTDASNVNMGTSPPVNPVHEEMTRTDGRARDHRQDVIERVKTLRAEKRSFRDIAAALNAEGVATFTGQGRWHHGMLPRLLHAIKANDQTP
jgi:transposase-like protein